MCFLFLHVGFCISYVQSPCFDVKMKQDVLKQTPQRKAVVWALMLS